MDELDDFQLNLTDSNAGNETDLLATSSHFKPIIDYLLLTILIVIMLAIGCEITWVQLMEHVKRPIGICIGMVSQFVIMPLTAFSLMQCVQVSGLYATGILIISCCPGGVLSNVFTYYCDGDLPLSVAMTSVSTLLAMGMMPLNVWIYGRSLESGDLVLPYDNLALALVSITSPVIVGMLIRWKWPKAAYFVTKIGSSIGLVFVIICIVLEVIVFPNMFTDVPAKLYGTIISLPAIGIILGFTLATFFKLPVQAKKTIAIECGVQNVPTALTVISLSFDVEVQGDIILLPWLYGFSMMGASLLICLSYQICKRWKERAHKKTNSLYQDSDITNCVDILPSKEIGQR